MDENQVNIRSGIGGKIKLVGLANSTSYVMDANGLEPDANALQDSGRARSASDAMRCFARFMRSRAAGRYGWIIQRQMPWQTPVSRR